MPGSTVPTQRLRAHWASTGWMQSASVLQGWGGSQTRTRPVLRYHFTCPTRTRRGLGQRHTVLQPRCWQNEKRQTPSASAPTSHIVERNGDTPPSEMLTVPTCPSSKVTVESPPAGAWPWPAVTTTNASNAGPRMRGGLYHTGSEAHEDQTPPHEGPPWLHQRHQRCPYGLCSGPGGSPRPSRSRGDVRFGIP